MGIITMIIIGLIAGAIARLLIPGRQHIGLLATIVVGIVGSYVGGALGSLVFPPHVFSVHPPVNHLFLGSIVGAVIVLLIFNMVRSRA